MCGINGYSGKIISEKLIHEMNNAIIHRGPDDDGVFHSEHFHMGMRRLSIVDLTHGKQPIANQDESIWVVFNGEIYNHKALRQELIKKGHVFKTHHSDTEIIVHLYEEDPENWVQKINGMFAIALVDLKKNRLLLYRDRLGKKPLYYAIKSNQIIFSSEIKAILTHPNISKALNFDSFYQYFSNKNISAPRTAYKDIFELLPGHILTWEKDSKYTIKPYWKIDFSNNAENINETEIIHQLDSLLTDSVKLRADCDVAYGAYLSGGLDSSLVVSLMNQATLKKVKTFCLGYEDKASGQFVGKNTDIYFAKKMSEILNTEHYEYIVNAQQFAESLPGIIQSFDQPFSGTVSTYMLSTFMKKHIKVALSGDGADEIFGSYLPIRLAYPVDYFNKINKQNFEELDQNDLNHLAPFNSKDQFNYLKKMAASNQVLLRDKLSVFTIQEREQLLSPLFIEQVSSKNLNELNIYSEISKNLTARDPINAALEIDQKELLVNQILPFVDRLSMAHSIEVRSPFLDYRIVELINRLPGDYKVRLGTTKYIIKKLGEKYLPKELVHRPKEGFVQPIYSWMHTSLHEWCLSCLLTLPKPFFNQNYLESLISEFKKHNEAYNAKIWNLVCFSEWYNNGKR